MLYKSIHPPLVSSFFFSRCLVWTVWAALSCDFVAAEGILEDLGAAGADASFDGGDLVWLPLLLLLWPIVGVRVLRVVLVHVLAEDAEVAPLVVAVWIGALVLVWHACYARLGGMEG